MKLRPLVVLALWLPLAASAAGVTRCDGPDGQVSYQDRPCDAGRPS